MLELESVHFHYPGGADVFAGVDWVAGAGESWAVIGPSGCGKSTLLLLLSGLLRPQSGIVRVAGSRVTGPSTRTGLVLQDYELLPWATVRANAALGLRVARRRRGSEPTRRAGGERVEHWLCRLGIRDVAARYPRQISGGQRQRCAIARALAIAPSSLLMDEPFSALDQPTREDLQELTVRLCAEAGLTLVLVTHSIGEAAFIGQKILILTAAGGSEPVVLPNPHTPDAGYRDGAAHRRMSAELRSRLAAG